MGTKTWSTASVWLILFQVHWTLGQNRIPPWVTTQTEPLEGPTYLHLPNGKAVPYTACYTIRKNAVEDIPFQVDLGNGDIATLTCSTILRLGIPSNIIIDDYTVSSDLFVEILSSGPNELFVELPNGILLSYDLFSDQINSENPRVAVPPLPVLPGVDFDALLSGDVVPTKIKPIPIVQKPISPASLVPTQVGSRLSHAPTFKRAPLSLPPKPRPPQPCTQLPPCPPQPCFPQLCPPPCLLEPCPPQPCLPNPCPPVVTCSPPPCLPEPCPPQSCFPQLCPPPPPCLPEPCPPQPCLPNPCPPVINCLPPPCPPEPCPPVITCLPPPCPPEPCPPVITCLPPPCLPEPYPPQPCSPQPSQTVSPCVPTPCLPEPCTLPSRSHCPPQRSLPQQCPPCLPPSCISEPCKPHYLSQPTTCHHDSSPQNPHSSCHSQSCLHNLCLPPPSCEAEPLSLWDHFVHPPICCTPTPAPHPCRTGCGPKPLTCHCPFPNHHSSFTPSAFHSPFGERFYPNVIFA